MSLVPDPVLDPDPVGRTVDPMLAEHVARVVYANFGSTLLSASGYRRIEGESPVAFAARTNAYRREPSSSGMGTQKLDVTRYMPVALVFDDFDSAARPLGVPLHATQLYATLGGLLIAFAVSRLSLRRPGLRVGAFFVLYGAMRLAIEPLRADYRGTVAGVPTTALGAVAIALAGAGLISTARLRYDPVKVSAEAGRGQA